MNVQPGSVKMNLPLSDELRWMNTNWPKPKIRSNSAVVLAPSRRSEATIIQAEALPGRSSRVVDARHMLGFTEHCSSWALHRLVLRRILQLADQGLDMVAIPWLAAPFILKRIWRNQWGPGDCVILGGALQWTMKSCVGQHLHENEKNTNQKTESSQTSCSNLCHLFGHQLNGCWNWIKEDPVDKGVPIDGLFFSTKQVWRFARIEGNAQNCSCCINCFFAGATRWRHAGGVLSLLSNSSLQRGRLKTGTCDSSPEAPPTRREPLP